MADKINYRKAASRDRRALTRALLTVPVVASALWSADTLAAELACRAAERALAQRAERVAAR